jgi:hypothetical protein
MRDQLRARNGDRMRLHKCTAPTPPGPKRQEADMRIDGSVAPFHTGRSDRVGLFFFFLERKGQKTCRSEIYYIREKRNG